MGQGNAGAGLDLFVVNTTLDVTANDPDSVLGVVIRAYLDTHRGFRLARIFDQVHGDYAVEVVTTSRSYTIVAQFNDVGGIRGLCSVLGTLTREQAAKERNPLLPMFVYAPPRIGFTESQQALLAAALDGGTDNIVSRLGLPLTSIKARWGRIQGRAFRNASDLFAELPEATRPQHRGA